MIAPAGPVYQAGTLSGNPLSVAAGLATLRDACSATPDAYGRLEALGARAEAGLRDALAATGRAWLREPGRLDADALPRRRAGARLLDREPRGHRRLRAASSSACWPRASTCRRRSSRPCSSRWRTPRRTSTVSSTGRAGSWRVAELARSSSATRYARGMAMAFEFTGTIARRGRSRLVPRRALRTGRPGARSSLTVASAGGGVRAPHPDAAAVPAARRWHPAVDAGPAPPLGAGRRPRGCWRRSGARGIAGGVVVGGAAIGLSTLPLRRWSSPPSLRGGRRRLAFGMLFVKLAAFLGLGWLVFAASEACDRTRWDSRWG